jgi:hypothetical protein
VKVITKVIHISGLALASIQLCAARPEDPLPPGWIPDLRLVEEVVTRFYENGGQQGFNLRTGRVLEIRDVELALVYLQLYAVLPATAQRKLKDEQIKWLRYRDDEVEKITPKDASRGTIDGRKRPRN